MQHRARALESNRQSVPGRGADASAPRPTPLTLVSGAVAGDDLQRVANAASDALGLPVAIAIPAVGELVVSPVGALHDAAMRDLVQHAAAVMRGDAIAAPATVTEAVAVRIGEEIVGIVAAAAGAVPDAPGAVPDMAGAVPDVAGAVPDMAGAVPEVTGAEAAGGARVAERLAWLEAAAAAAAVAALMRETQEVGLEGSRRALLRALAAAAPADITAFVQHARRLGFELGYGAVAICAQPEPGSEPPRIQDVPASHDALIADMGQDRVLGLVPITSVAAPAEVAQKLAGELAARGMVVALSTPRRGPEALHEALREAELLVELAAAPDAPLAGQEETYRLLIGVLLRDAEELELLRARTISPLADYDAQHDTDLLATLQAFLAHHGSTTETAEAMHLHRHTVGYRLSRVHEVSALSPYESDGRERLSLGLKAHQILVAMKRLAARE